MMPRQSVLGVLLLAILPAARADDVSLQPLRATVRVSDGKRSGTGFVVALPQEDGGEAAHLLVTAAHVFTNNKGPECTVMFRAAGGPAGFERRELKLTVRNGETALWERHPTADVAVIEVTPPADADLQPFTLDQLADRGRIEAGAVAAGQRIWVACFPAQLESNRAGWPILRHGTIASHPLFPVDATPTIFLDYSHFGGDSGAAAVADVGGRPVVVGVVVSMQRQTDRVTSPFEERTIHTPLDLAIAVQAALVRDTIAAWRKNHAVQETTTR
jgi:hypothetical protein